MKNCRIIKSPYRGCAITGKVDEAEYMVGDIENFVSVLLINSGYETKLGPLDVISFNLKRLSDGGFDVFIETALDLAPENKNE